MREVQIRETSQRTEVSTELVQHAGQLVVGKINIGQRGLNRQIERS